MVSITKTIILGNRTHTALPRTQPMTRLIVPLEGFRKDLIWAFKMESVVREAAKKIHIGEINSARALLDFLANNYREYAVKNSLNQSYPTYLEKVGIWRDANEPPYTSKMARGGSQYEDRINSLTKTPRTFPGTFVMREKANGTLIEVMKIKKPTHNSEYIECIWCLAKDAYDYILPHLENMFKDFIRLKKELNTGELKRNDETLDKIIRHVAEVHWWLSFGKFFKRGSAGINDMYTKTLFESLDIYTSHWLNCSPDLEAFVTPLVPYKLQYPELFISPPCFKYCVTPGERLKSVKFELI